MIRSESRVLEENAPTGSWRKKLRLFLLNEWNLKRFQLGAALAILAVAFLAYSSALQAGFFIDDWYFLGSLAQGRFVEFFEWLGHRPLFALLYFFEYVFFGFNASGYHLLKIIAHAINALLLLVLVSRISRNRRVALAAGLFFATLPTISFAVYWTAVQDPMMTMFYLLAIWFWIDYLEGADSRRALLSVACFGMALLTKENAITLLVILPLIQKFLLRSEIRKQAKWYVVYASVGIIIFAYALVFRRYSSFISSTAGSYTDVGLNSLVNFVRYLEFLASPGWLEGNARSLWFLVSILLFVVVALRNKSSVLSFLGLAAILNILPFVGILPYNFNPYVLYLPALVSSTLWVMLIEALSWKFVVKRQQRIFMESALIAFLMVLNTQKVWEEGQTFNDWARARRVSARDIGFRHPTFPIGTYLYFIQPPNPLLELSGMLSARYGTNLIVGGSDSSERARLREYSHTYIYYLDEQGHSKEQAVNQLVSIKNQLVLPLDFDVPIRFEGYELVNDNLKHGEALILLLYWRSTGVLDKDYTVFAHLSNEKKEIVAAADGQPRAGGAPTSSWKPNQFVVDWSVIPITDEIPSGKYSLGIGMYYLPTMERLSFKDEKGLSKDTIVIQPIEILE